MSSLRFASEYPQHAPDAPAPHARPNIAFLAMLVKSRPLRHQVCSRDGRPEAHPTSRSKRLPGKSGVEQDDGTSDLAALQFVECAIDFSELDALGDHLIELQLAGHIKVDQPGHIDRKTI